MERDPASIEADVELPSGHGSLPKLAHQVVDVESRPMDLQREDDESPLLSPRKTGYLRQSLSRVKSFGDLTLESMRNSSPVPIKQLIAICATQVSQAMQITLPYTIAVYIVRDFGFESEKEVARKTGLLASFFCLAMFLTAYFWGCISDTYGRKPVIVIGNLASTVTVVLFGLASSYKTACVIRFMGGFFNGILGAVKTVLGESCSAEDQGQALLYLSISWGVGTTIGPTIGGVLAKPCEKFGHMPLCGEGELFNTSPYLLPCLVTSFASLIATLTTAFAMDETLDKPDKSSAASHVHGQDSLDTVEDRTEDHAPRSRLPILQRVNSRSMGPYLSRMGSMMFLPRVGSFKRSATDSGERVLAEVGMVAIKRRQESSGSSGSDDIGLLEDSAEEEAAGHQKLEFEDKGTGASDHVPNSGDSGLGLGDTNVEISLVETETDFGRDEDFLEGGETDTPKESETPWWKLPPVLLTLAGYGFVAFIYNLSDEVAPIYASAPPEDGGLGFSTSQLGLPLAVSGMAVLTFAALACKRVQRLFGIQRLARFGLYLSIPVWIGIPAASLVMPSTKGAMGVLSLALTFKAVAGVSTFTSSMVMVNVAAPPKQLGAVNGMGQSVAAFVRGVGPAIGGLLWSLSLGTGLPYHQFMVFVGLSIASFCASLIYLPSILVIPNL